MICPKCHSDNPSDSRFCSKCGTQIIPSEGVPYSQTETLQTPVKELARGSVFASRYEIIEELGKGGMGKVYKVFDKDIKEAVALKLLKPEIASDQETIERFRNELKYARNIGHRNVCRMYDLGKAEGTHYITMEYVAGEDLKSFIRRSGQLTVGKAVFIGKQVCEGLAEAHRLGVVHRDLKPQNIMIDKEGNARIMDFGIARSVKAKGITGAGVMIGTPEYMSPEQVEGKEADSRSDIYSLGVILYEMLTGRVPFEGDTPLSVAVKQKTETPCDPKTLNAQVPSDLSEVVLKCMSKEKERRYQKAQEVLSELVNIEKGIPTTERVTVKKEPLTSREITVKFRLKKLFIPALAVIVLAALGVTGWLLIPRKPGVKHSIAVISFKNQTGDKAFDYLQEAIPNLLITNLEQSRYLRVTTWERMADLLRQMGKENVQVIDKDLGFNLCLRSGIEAIVTGSFIKAGDMFATDAKVFDVKTKNLLKSASSKSKGVDSILKSQIDELSREIARGVGLSQRALEAAPLRIADMTTSSMDAYDCFLKGRESYDNMYYDQARQFLEKAVALDPTFATAYLLLANTYYSLGNRKATNEAFEKAKTYSEKATEKESLFIEAGYAAMVERNPGKRLRILNEITKKYPEEKRAYYLLGFYFDTRGMLPEAIKEYDKVLELDPNYGVALNQLAYAYMSLENYKKAEEYLKRYAAAFPKEANPLDSLAEFYLKMGKLDEAIAKYKEALDVKPDFFQSCSNISYIQALKENYPEAIKWIDQYIARAPSPGLKAGGYSLKAFYYVWLGSFNRSLREIETAKEMRVAGGAKEESRAALDGLKAWIYYESGDIEAGRKSMKNWEDYCMAVVLDEYKPAYQEECIFYSGLADIKQGRIESAKSRLAEMNVLLPKVDSSSKSLTIFFYNLLSAEVLLAEGEVEKAIAVMEKTEVPEMINTYINSLEYYNIPPLRDVLARAYVKKGERDKAIAEYERLITLDPQSKDRRLINPLYHYRLARLYDEKGLKEKAKQEFEKFLSLWKDADPGRPEVEDAKKRVANL